ncbi:MAG: hypothetical protein O3C60_18495 [Planctomycetota bacterium]|nr:hypothetical protein [Planctomycetota bacterium]
MLPIQICRHWQGEWLGSRDCVCQDCGKLGHWFDGMVLWQRRTPAWNRATTPQRLRGQRIMELRCQAAMGPSLYPNECCMAEADQVA